MLTAASRCPRRWHRIFAANGLAIQRLPFGWSFSPAVFQELGRLVRNTVRRFGVRSWVYLDDFLLASTCRATLHRVCHMLLSKLRGRGLLSVRRVCLSLHPTLSSRGKRSMGWGGGCSTRRTLWCEGWLGGGHAVEAAPFAAGPPAVGGEAQVRLAALHGWGLHARAGGARFVPPAAPVCLSHGVCVCVSRSGWIARGHRTS